MNAEFFENILRELCDDGELVNWHEQELEPRVAARTFAMAVAVELAERDVRLAEMRQRVREALTWLGPDGAHEPVRARARGRAVAALHEALCSAGAAVLWARNGSLEHGERDWFGPPGCRRGLTRIHPIRLQADGDEFEMIGHVEMWGIHGEDRQEVTIAILEPVNEATTA